MSNIITAKLVEGEGYRTESLWQWDYGQVLQFIEADLPDTYEVHFSNTKHGDAVKMIGDASGVSIPDMMLVTGQTVFVWLYLHTGDSDGETEYQITIPVKNRARPVEDQPTPVQQSLLEQALAALNIAVAQCNADVSHFPIVIEDYWCVWNEAEQQWVSTGTRAIGYSPVANVSKTGDTATITVTDESGTTTAQIKDGKDGVDGFTPSAAVSKSGGTATITITDKDGTTSAQVSDGETGATPVIAIGTVSKLAPGSNPTATMDSTDPEHPVLSMGLVTGDPGEVSQAQLDAVETELKSAVDGKASIIRDSVSNVPIASVPDAAANLPLSALKIAIEPVQDLHGQASPYPAGGGVNKFGDYTVLNCYIYGDGTLTSANDNRTYIIPIQPSTTYAYKINRVNATGVSLNDDYQIGEYYGDSRPVVGETGARLTSAGYADNVGTGTFTTSASAKWLGVKIANIAKTNAEATAATIQVEIGSSVSPSYSPYSNICPITGWTGCNVKRTGINIFDGVLERANINWTTFIFTPSPDGRFASKNYIRVEPGETYYISHQANNALAVYEDDSGNGGQSISVNYNTHTFTIPAGKHYMKFGINEPDEPTNICINYPATDTSYNAYVGTTYPISWQTEAGTVYGAEYDLVTGAFEVNRQCSSVVANSINNNGKDTTKGVYKAFYHVTGRKYPADVFSNIFNTIQSGKAWSMDVRTNGDGVEFNIPFDALGVSAEDDTATVMLPAAKTWFTNNNVQLCYYLATPLTYQLDPIEVKTLIGQNNVWADCGNILLMEYGCDTKGYIDKKLAELTALILENN